MPDVMKTRDKAFRPVDVKMGPDGAIYIADWCNPIINHGEVDFRDPRRDKTRGRIWRLTFKDRKVLERPKIAGATIDELLELHKSPEDYTRRQARLALREMDRAKVTAALDVWTAKQTDDFVKLQALWTYQTIGAPHVELLEQLLRAKDPGVRTAATRVMASWAASISNPLDMLKAQLADEHPRVRLEAVRACAAFALTQSFALAMSVLDQPVDLNVDYALYLTCNELQSTWLPAFQSGQLALSPKKLEFALKAIRNPAAIKPLVEQFKAGNVAVESRKEVAELIASLGEGGDLAMLFERAAAASDNLTKSALLATLDRAIRQRNLRPKLDLAQLKSLIANQSDEMVSAAALRLAGAVRAESLRDVITVFATKADQPRARHAAIGSLADLGGDASKIELAKLAANPAATEALVAATALASLDPVQAAPLTAVALAKITDAEFDRAQVINAFLKRRDGAVALGKAIAAAKLPPDAAKLTLRALYALGHSNPELVEPLKAAAGLTAEAKPLSPDEMKQFIADVQSKGDRARGQAIFNRADTSCVRCHAIAGQGGKLAPDLSSIGTAAPMDYIVDSILAPQKAIKENYHATIVDTADGDTLIGIKVRQTDRELVLRDAIQDEIVIPLNTIKGKPRDGGSMMPAGLADPLTRQEMLDLVRYLSELGR
jgi:putative heme-binding domain-containing protein